MRLFGQAVSSAAAGAAIIGAIIAATGEARAQSIPYGTLVPGNAAAKIVQSTGSWCAVEGGASSYRRTGVSEAFIDVTEVFFTETTYPTAYHRVRGVGRLTFTAATSGVITFDPPSDEPDPAIAQPTFTFYTETWEAAKKRLTVQFNVRFSSCVVRYVARYFAP